MCPHLPCFLCLCLTDLISQKILCSWCFSFLRFDKSVNKECISHFVSILHAIGRSNGFQHFFYGIAHHLETTVKTAVLQTVGNLYFTS